MVDLDSNPTKLIEIVEIGKQLLMTRGSLTTFSIANDVAKYFAIIPAAFATTYPVLGRLNVMGLTTPAERHPVGRHLQRAHHHRADPARAARRALPRRRAPRPCCATTCSIYGLGGIVAPFIGIKAIDMVLSGARARLTEETIMKQLRPALLVFTVMTVLTGVAYPLVVTAIAQVVFPAQANGSLIVKDGKVRRLGPHRAAVRRPEVLLEPALRDVAGGLQRRGVVGLEPGSAERHAHRRGPRPGGRPQGSRPGQRAAHPRRSRDRVGQRPRPAHQPGRRSVPGCPRGAGARVSPRRRSRTLVARYTHGRQWGVFGEPVVDVLALNLALDASGTK